MSNAAEALVTTFQVTSAACRRGYTTVAVSRNGCAYGSLLRCMQVLLPMGQRKVHVEWLVEVKFETLKEVWLQAHCRADRGPHQAVPPGCLEHHDKFAEWARCKAPPCMEGSLMTSRCSSSYLTGGGSC